MLCRTRNYIKRSQLCAVEKRPHGEEKSRRPPKKEQRNVNSGTSISFSVSPSLHTQIVLTDFETNNLVYMKTDPDCLIADHCVGLFEEFNSLL